MYDGARMDLTNHGTWSKLEQAPKLVRDLDEEDMVCVIYSVHTSPISTMEGSQDRLTLSIQAAVLIPTEST